MRTPRLLFAISTTLFLLLLATVVSGTGAVAASNAPTAEAPGLNAGSGSDPGSGSGSGSSSSSESGSSSGSGSGSGSGSDPRTVPGKAGAVLEISGPQVVGVQPAVNSPNAKPSCDNPVIATAVPELRYDRTTKRLFCNYEDDFTYKMVKALNSHYHYIACNESGWFGYADSLGREYPAGKAAAVLDVRCKKYCDVDGDPTERRFNTRLSTTLSSPIVVLDCPNSNQQISGKTTTTIDLPPEKSYSCSLKDGWVTTDGQLTSVSAFDDAIKFNCTDIPKQYCCERRCFTAEQRDNTVSNAKTEETGEVWNTTCKSAADHKLFFNDTNIPGDWVTCSEERGWFTAQGRIQFTNDTHSLPFECRKIDPPIVEPIVPTETTTTTEQSIIAPETDDSDHVTEKSEADKQVGEAGSQASTIILGCTIGGVIFVAIVAAAIIMLLKRQAARKAGRKKSNEVAEETEDVVTETPSVDPVAQSQSVM